MIQIACLFCLCLARQANSFSQPGRRAWSSYAGAASALSLAGSTLSPSLERVDGECANGVSELAQIVLVTPSGAVSPFEEKPFGNEVTWNSVFNHVADRMSREAANGRFDASKGDLKLDVVTTEELAQGLGRVVGASKQSPILVLAGLHGAGHVDLAKRIVSEGKFEAISTVDCAPEVARLEKYGEYEGDGSESGLLSSVDNKIGAWFKTKRSSNKSAADLIRSLWRRKSVEDTLFAMLVLVNEYTDYFVASVQEATTTAGTGLKEVQCMCSKCSKEMIDCFGNPECRKALDCLNACKANDQVCSYKCITSYETKAFEAFALCILQKNNCMGNKATVPVVPDPAAMGTFRGLPLDEETGEEILVGHLAPRDGESNVLLQPDAPVEQWSWKVVCGVNPAYDYFSDQHQIFYRDKDRRSVMWYDPTFKVVTLDEREVWRRRHYRVRRKKNTGPGTFGFTVLDNGVLSDEFWRILDCADDMSWAVFYYSGAASAAGTSYQGGLVCTRTGEWPSMPGGTDDPTYKRISAALQKGGIEMYELFEVKQSEVDRTPPPLGYK